MSSSDSDGEAFYDSIVRNVAIIRDQYRKEKTAEKLVITAKESGSNSNNLKNNSETGANDSLVDLLSEDGLVDEIIAKNSKPNSKRKRKQNINSKSQFEDVNTITKGKRGRKRGRGSKSNASDGSRDIVDDSFGNLTNISDRGTRLGLRNRNKTLNNTSQISEDSSDNTDSPNIRSRLDRRAKNSTNRRSVSIEDVATSNSRLQRGRSPAITRDGGRGINRGRGMLRSTVPSYIYPTYSVGNTDEYPDESAEVQLFSMKPTKDTNDVVVIDNEVYEDNEELSVKVIWQGFDIFRFTIYKYEKLTKIFDLFTKKENVSNDKLLFTYNEKSVTVNDTPASIGYNVAKFINGGLNNKLSGVTNYIKSGPKIKIKFQCQKMKKPFDVLIPKNEKLSLAMSKCAEHLNLPLNKLKFNFDGDVVLGTSMPQDIELENGDCIDVLILT